MENAALPHFQYHPDPIATGSIECSNAKCECCDQSRGYIYTGHAFAIDEVGNLCPWCIADGSAHAKYDASFTDENGIGDYGSWDAVPKDVVDEIAYRTPGFCGWQQERWWTHCGNAAEYLGRAGHAEAVKAGDDFLTIIRNEIGYDEGTDWDEFLSSLDKEGSPTAYLFRCKVCGKYGGYFDCD